MEKGFFLVNKLPIHFKKKLFGNLQVLINVAETEVGRTRQNIWSKWKETENHNMTGDGIMIISNTEKC